MAEARDVHLYLGVGAGSSAPGTGARREKGLVGRIEQRRLGSQYGINMLWGWYSRRLSPAHCGLRLGWRQSAMSCAGYGRALLRVCGCGLRAARSRGGRRAGAAGAQPLEAGRRRVGGRRRARLGGHGGARRHALPRRQPVLACRVARGGGGGGGTRLAAAASRDKLGTTAATPDMEAWPEPEPEPALLRPAAAAPPPGGAVVKGCQPGTWMAPRACACCCSPPCDEGSPSAPAAAAAAAAAMASAGRLPCGCRPRGAAAAEAAPVVAPAAASVAVAVPEGASQRRAAGAATEASAGLAAPRLLPGW